MTKAPEPDRQQRRMIRLMLIEDDPVFRLGLITALEQAPDLRVLFESDSSNLALRVLQDWTTAQTAADPAVAPARFIPDLIILSLDLGLAKTGRSSGLALCQQLKTLYPQLPQLLISSRQDPLVLATALQIGANGYCLRGTDTKELITAIRRIARGQPYWGQAMQAITQALATSQSAPVAAIAEQGWNRTASNRVVPVREIQTGVNDVILRPLSVLRRNWRRSGIRQIEAELAHLERQLQSQNLSVLDELVLTGRRRELLAARWLVNRLLTPTDLAGQAVAVQAAGQQPQSQADAIRANNQQQGNWEPASELSARPPSSDAASTPPQALVSSPPAALRSLRAALLDAIAARLQTSLRNLTDTPLELDILKEEKKRELLLSILRKLEEILDDLRFSQVSADQLPEKRDVILLDLWQATMTSFFGKYYTLDLNGSQIEIVDVLLRDADIVQSAILDAIPFVSECLSHLLFQTPLVIDDATYAVGTVEAMARMEFLLQNLIIRVANAVVQPMLNRFGNVEDIKRSFYDIRLLSTREIERFRNNLSWRYRLERLVGEPTAIFESRYNLFVLRTDGIVKTSIYAPRNQDLEQLSGIPLAVTLALEARDAIAPRVRSVVGFLGSGVVYVLTDVIGRGIGLIGRGIVKGIGNALQDARFSRNGERR